MKSPQYIANFDSASAMLRATAFTLKGEDFPVLGVGSRATTKPLEMLGAVVNSLPSTLREQVYIWSGWNEAAASSKLSKVSIERICQWAVREYPQRQYPAAMIGSSNGANVHLCGALGIPWLPQTFLVPVKRSGPHPDELKEEIKWSIRPACDLLEANPDIVLHHMHDPNQDRLMVRRMCYFRIKKRTLGAAYENFLLRSLEPGATLYVMNCRLRWPTLQLQDRHFFQFGALGGATVDEFLHGGPRVRAYLARYGSHLRRWESPTPTAESPEAEWGFEPALAEDIRRFADRHGFQIKTISFNEPEDFSPFVADFYRWFNERRGIIGNRLLVESFIMMEPHWTLRTGSVPYWMFFNMIPSAERLEAFLSKRSFDEIYMMLFSHGVESVGLASIERWRELLEKAIVRGRFLGVDEKNYPRDFAAMAAYLNDLKNTIASRYPLPAPLDPEEMEAFLGGSGRRYSIELKTGLAWDLAAAAKEFSGRAREGRAEWSRRRGRKLGLPFAGRKGC